MLMTIQIQKTAQPLPSWHDEMVLVVKRNDFFHQDPAWEGLKHVNFDTYLALIQEKKEFLPRGIMETDVRYKQIIPYLVFTYEGRYFLMQRTAHNSESRLKNKFSLGIGGHIRQEDLKDNSIFSWAEREFHEEVDYKDPFTIQPLGILNDDATAVGQVHIGFVFLIRGTTPHIKVKSELKSGELLSLHECKSYRDMMEGWSQTVYDFLIK